MKGTVLYCKERIFKDKEDPNKSSKMYCVTVDVESADDYVEMWTNKPYEVNSEVEFVLSVDGKHKPRVKLA